MVQNRNNIDLEIILLLLNGDIHLRKIAKNLGESHSTIFRKLGGLLKNKVIDYKIEGKNKVFFIRNNLEAKTYVFNAEMYKLIKILRKYPEISIVLEDIIKKSAAKMVILFGSYAKFIAKPDSDIDIYAESTNKKEKEEMEMINSKISVKLGSFDLNSNLIKEIVKDHVILKGVEEFYEKSNFFV